MSVITPLGTAVGPSWQYRLRRDSLSTAWRDWSADPDNPVYFDTDPDGGALRLNTTYFLHARNPLLPAGLPGSMSSELAAGLQITDTGQVVPVTATGKVDDLAGSSSSGAGFLNLDQVQPGQLFTAQLINNRVYAVAISRTQLLTELLTLIGQTSSLKTLFCELASSCDLPAGDSYEWIIDEQYEEVIDEVVVPTNLTVLIDSADFVALGTGIFRIAGPTTLVEGAAGQYSVEEQLTTGSWAASSASVVWSTVGAPVGVSINSGSGLLTVGANTLSADVNISIHAALQNSVVELPVTLSNTAPAITGYHISGPAAISEGATSAPYSVIIDYADGSTLVYIGSGTYSLIGAPSGVSLNGGSNAQSTITAALNAVSANTDITLRFTLPSSTQINKTVTVQDLPCTSHDMLTQSQYDAMPSVAIFEYADPDTPNGPLSYTSRSFASRSEALANLSISRDESRANYDFLRATTSNCSVGDVLYGDNRVDHVQAATNAFYPVEAGWWGFQWNTPGSGVAGSVILLQTNACGEIITRESVSLPALATNYALSASSITASSTLSGYPASSVADGDKTPGDWGQTGWASAATSGTVDEHLDFNLAQATQFSQLVLYSLPDNYLGRTSSITAEETFSAYGITAFRVQVPNGSGGWTTLQTVTANNLVRKAVTFTPVTTNIVRLQIDGIGSATPYAGVLEVELFGPQS